MASRGLTVLVDGLYTSHPRAGLDELPLASCDVRGHQGTRTGPVVRSPALLDHAARVLPSTDVVHLNGHYNTLNYHIARLCREAGVPYLISARSELDPAAHALRPEHVHNRLRPLEADYVNGAFALHFTSEFELKRAHFDAGEPRSVVTVPNPVQLEHLADPVGRAAARALLGVPGDRFAMLFFGRLIPQKQPGFALEVLARLDDVDAELYFVGTGDEHELRERARRLGVSDRVHFVGHVCGLARQHWMAAADVLLLPSSAENFSLALVESVSAGLPCISSPHIGALEFLAPADCEPLPLDPDVWARRCANVSRRARPDGEEAFTRLWNRFRPDHIVGEWLAVYDALPPMSPFTTATRPEPAPEAVARWARDRRPCHKDRELSLTRLAGGASSRAFYRLAGAVEPSVVAMLSSTRQGDYLSVPYDSTGPLDWIVIARLLHDAGLPVPEVLLHDEDRDWLLVEDFGDTTLESALATASPQVRNSLYRQALELLVRLQSTTLATPPNALPLTRSLDASTLCWEFFHFVEWGLEARRGATIADADRVLLLREFGRLSDELAGAGQVLTHRDFHAQNLMVRPDASLGLLDFDDLLLGNPAYDLASLLFDPRHPLDDEFVTTMVDEFFNLRRTRGMRMHRRGEFHRLFEIQGLQRSLKAAGRFVWLARQQGRTEYLAPVDHLLTTVARLLERHQDLAVLRDRLARYEPLLS